jgi:hypothetical protein
MKKRQSPPISVAPPMPKQTEPEPGQEPPGPGQVRRKTSPEQMQLRIREIEDRMLKRGQHPAKVAREMAQLYKVEERCVQEWIAKARARWRCLTGSDDLIDRQEQLELMAHELYERAISEKEWGEIDELAGQMMEALEADDLDKLRSVCWKIAKLKGQAKPNLKVAVTLIANLGRFYGLGQTIKLDVPGLAFGAAKGTDGKGQ